MSFDSNKYKTTSKKNILLDLILGLNSDFWVSYGNFIWYYDFNYEYNLIYSGFITGFSVLEINKINNVKCDGLYLDSVTSLAGLDSESKYYFDITTKILYIRCPNNDSPFLFNTVVGSVIGFGNFNNFFDNVNYDGRLLNVPNISKSKDKLNFGKISFDNAIISLDNSDGYFDSYFEDNNLFGQEIFLKVGFNNDDITDYKTIYTGNIESVKINSKKIELKIVDKRKQLNNLIATNLYTTSEYPYMDISNKNKRKAIIFGSVKNIPAICITDNATTFLSLSYSFEFIDLDSDINIISISAVYSDTTLLTTSAYSISGDNRTFNIFNASSTNYIPGNTVTLDCVASYSNSLDAIKWILTNKADITYTTDYFNTIDWTSYTSQVFDIGYYINDNTDIKTAIEKISASNLGNFIVQDDGLFNFNLFDSNDTGIVDIKKEEFISAPNISFDSKDLLGTLDINYNKDNYNNIYEIYTDNSNEEYIKNTFGVTKYYSFDTLLTTETDAISFSSKAIILYGLLNKETNIMTKSQYIDLEIGNIINVEISRPVNSMLGNKKCEIIGINKNLNDFTVDFDLRIIGDA